MTPQEALDELVSQLGQWGAYRKAMDVIGKPFNMPQTFDEMLLEHGHSFIERAKTTWCKPNSKQCFLNAWDYWRGRVDLRYCEGKVILGSLIDARLPLAIEHGWCVDRDGVVHDPSVSMDELCVYHGVVFKDDFAKDSWTKLRHPRHQLIGIIPNLWCMREIEFDPARHLDTEFLNGDRRREHGGDLDGQAHRDERLDRQHPQDAG